MAYSSRHPVNTAAQETSCAVVTPMARASWSDGRWRPTSQREGLLAPDADLEWTRQVYYALLGEALNRPGTDEDPAAQDPDAQATLVIDTLLHGAGPRG
ncbi:hypothetical protein [Streptomyces canus]|uniref:hypothetical protein n=1 Tax=Streptomyces canus TaxID=58343 RepID=UPI0033A454AB